MDKKEIRLIKMEYDDLHMRTTTIEGDKEKKMEAVIGSK